MIHKSVPKGHPANPFEAFRQLAYAHGVPELALLMGLKPGTLYNKADADEETHHQPTLRDVMLATRLTGDMRVLDSLNEQFGRAAFDVTPYANTSDEALLDLLLTLGQESGEFHGVTRSALIDRNFNRASLNVIRAEAFDMVSALMTLVARLEGLLDE
jgi:hypothetical protein